MKHIKPTKKKQVLAHASHLIHTKGFHTTTINEVISAAGIKKGGLYHHFKSKDQLGIEVLELKKQKFISFLQELSSSKEPGAALELFFDTVLQKHREAGFVGGCIFGNMALEMADENQMFADITTEIFIEWIHQIEKIIRAAQDKDQVRGDIPALSLARFTVMSIEGGIMLSRLTKNEKPLKECLELLKITLQLHLPCDSV